MREPGPNVLLIVSRHNSTLYSYACSEIEGLGRDIEVVLDRRRGDRRRAAVAGPPGDERRRAERRARQVDRELREIGWALIRRDLLPNARPLTTSGDPGD
jgi:hypothetical protein